jgi:hypothetical protein
MSKEEAETVGIKPDQRRRYFRVEAGKANMKPPAESVERSLTGLAVTG